MKFEHKPMVTKREAAQKILQNKKIDGYEISLRVFNNRTTNWQSPILKVFIEKEELEDVLYEVPLQELDWRVPISVYKIREFTD